MAPLDAGCDTLKLVDIHSHILPALDDGAQNFRDALDMLKMAAEGGTTDIVATPHASLEFRFDAALVEAAIAELQQRCGSRIRIHSGCDLHLTVENIRTVLQEPSRYTINHRNYLLVELPEFFAPAVMGEVFRQMRAVGIIPVITHPERHPFLAEHIDLLDQWVEKECLVQLTAQSLLGGFGRHPRKAAAKLLDRGLVHFVASDAHDTLHRPPLLADAFAHVAKAQGREVAEILFVANPKATLAGLPVTRFVNRHSSALQGHNGGA